jgi:DNA-binding response OmpR family regulator
MMDTKKRIILLVEDDTTLTEMYTMKFSGTGFDVWHAENGEEALRMMSEQGLPTIILLDVILPVMDGFTVLERLKENEEWRSVPVVMLTNLGQDEDMKRGTELGAVDYIVKASATPAQVVERIEKILL